MALSSCGCGGHTPGSGPFAEGRELVEFVSRAHGGALRRTPIRSGGLATACQGCTTPFTLETYVGTCPACGGVHAVSPPRADDPANIQYGGTDFAPD